MEIRKTKRDDTLNKKRNVPLTEVSLRRAWIVNRLMKMNLRIQQTMRRVESLLQLPLWRRLSSEPRVQNLQHSWLLYRGIKIIHNVHLELKFIFDCSGRQETAVK